MESIVSLDERLDRLERLLISNKKVLTFDEASDYTGISKSYLYKLTASAKVPHSKLRKLIFFDRVELDQWLLQNRIKTQQELADEANYYTLKKK